MEAPPLEKPLIEENLKTRSPFLDLGLCSLTDLPGELASMEWLEVLNLGDYYRDQDKSWLRSDNRGSENFLPRADFSVLEKLPRLRDLYVNRCGLSTVPFINNGLHVLSAQGNEISDVSEIARFCPDLEALFLDDNRIVDIEVLIGIAGMKELTLRNNSISDIGPLSQFPRLDVLVLSENEISDISPLAPAGNLTQLHIDSNRIGNWEILAKIPKLVRLSAYDNQMTDLTPLSLAPSLQTVNVGKNRIEDLSPLSSNASIRVLNLTDNPITRIEPLISMKNLEELYLSGNPIEDCPADVWQTGDIRQIRSWFGSRKKAKVRPKGKETESVSVKTSKTIAPARHDVKLILVGNSGVGKTQLSRYLVEGKYSNERLSTHGIRLDQWLPDDPLFENLKDTVSVNIWDFGGQEYYHGAYRLFLSNDAVYVLLWDKPTNVNGELETRVSAKKSVTLQHYTYDYWLENIRHYAPDSRILMVQNKIDLEGGKEHVGERVFSDYAIAWDYYISLQKAGQGDPEHRRSYEAFCTDLSRNLAETARISADYPPQWIDIREALKDMMAGRMKKDNPFAETVPTGDPWMPREAFESACLAIHDALTTDDLHTLPRWFHNSGLVIYFGDNPNLEDRIFTSPEWVTRNIYEILDQTVLKKKGEFGKKDVEAKKPGLGEMFLNLMQEMELIFERRDKPGTFIAPQYLPIHHPVEDLFAIAAGGLQKTSVSIRLPLYFYRKVMLKILYYFGATEWVTAMYYWRNGILFVKDDTRVLVKGYRPDPQSGTGLIVIGAEDTAYSRTIQKEIFNHILNVLDGKEWRLSDKLSNPSTSTEGGFLPSRSEGWTKRFRVPETEPTHEKPPRWLKTLEISTDGERFVNYLKACFAGQDGELTVKSDAGDKVLLKSLETLLDQTVLSPRRVFLSYSHKDSDMLNRLKPHLTLLKRMKNIASWSDQALLPGDPWDDVIKEKLHQADIVILLLTADFFASDYIWEKELKVALDRTKKGKARLVPVLMKPFDYESLKDDPRFRDVLGSEMILKDQNGQLVPVTLWENQEQAFEQISKKIRTVIEEDSTRS